MTRPHHLAPTRLPTILALAGAILTPAGHAWAADTDTGGDAAPVELAEVRVSDTAPAPQGLAADGYRSSTAAVGVLGTRAIQDIPYSVHVTSSELIENIQAGSATEALKYDPTVNPEMGSNRSGDYFAIRGFVNSTNQAIDGMRSELAYGVLEDKERIEVLSGASSFLYGMASPAGMIDYVLKRPTADTMLKATVGDYGGAQLYAHLDAGGPLDQAGRFGYRLNILGVNDGNTGVDEESRPRQLLSAAVDWHLQPGTLMQLDASHYHDNLEYAQAYFLVGSVSRIPDAPDASANYSAPYGHNERTYDTYGLKLTSAIDDRLAVRAALRHGRSENSYMGIRNQWLNDDGDYNQQMYYYLAPTVTETTQGKVFADLDFDTGGLRHKTTLGYVRDDIRNRSAGTTKYYFPAGTVFSMDAPGYQADPDVATDYPSHTSGRTRRAALVLADDIRFSDRWSALVGANYATIHDRSYSTSTGALSSDYDKGAVTPGLALTYKPDPALTAYLSYIEALEKGTTAPSTAANADAVLEPFRSSQYELGAKFSLGEVDFTAALFRIEKAGAYTDPVTNLYGDDGRQVHTGGEFSFTGKVTDRLTLLGGFSILDASIEKTSSAAMAGKTPQAVPEKLARLYAEYALPAVPGLVLTGGISYTGAMWANDANTLSLPDVVTGDIGVRYRTQVSGKNTVFRLTASNVTDERYWTSKGGSMLYLGSPRTLAASATVDF